MIRTLRRVAEQAVPLWLSIGTARATLQAIAIHCDLAVDWLVAGLHRLRTDAPVPDALELLGSERFLRRGPSETAPAFGARLVPWLDAHARRGSPLQLIAQVRAHFSALPPFAFDLVYRSGRVFSVAADGAVTVGQGSADELGVPAEQWANWFILLRPVADLPLDSAALRALLSDWGAGHAIGHCYVLHSGSHVWGEPGLVWGSPDLVWVDTPPRIVQNITA